MTDTIPVFPLDYVLLPGSPLPVHVFEPRYRQMLADIEGARNAFGVVALRRGAETSADVDFADIGTLAEILEKAPYPDGSCDLFTVGSRRFRVVTVDASSKPYLQAGVEWLDEDDGLLSPDLAPAVVTLYARYCRLLARLGVAGDDDELATDPVRLSYEVTARMHLSLAQRQRLLAMPTAADRLAAALAVLRREIALVSQTHTAPVATQVLRLRPGPS